MIFRPFYRFETGCAAYVFGCGGQGICCVVDPHEGDVDAYLEFANAKAMRIAYVFETHVHADHRSGGRALAEKAGAKYACIATPMWRFRSSRSTTARSSSWATRSFACSIRRATRPRASRSS